MDYESDAIALAVLDQYRKLPAKRKPTVRDNGLHEWVPLSGIVVKGQDFLQCVALATGMKCLPANKLNQANGVAIHDWHAEVLVLRAFNRFLLDECLRLARDSTAESVFLQRRTVEKRPVDNGISVWEGQPFSWREGLTLHMYCSEAPCGDASMELIMAAQDDPTPWQIPPSVAQSSSSSPHPPPSSTPDSTNLATVPTLLGRGYFSHLGVVRRKPSRADAPPTASKSCSDKLALKQCTSVLSSLTALFVAPSPGLYLSSVVIPASQYNEVGWKRCFETRMNSVSNEDLRDWWAQTGGYGFYVLKAEVTEKEFEFSRRGIVETASEEKRKEVKMTASNLAVAWTLQGGVNEALVGGVRQGRKAFDAKGASLMSRRRMWETATQIAAALGDGQLTAAVSKRTYDEVKQCRLLEGRQRVKAKVRMEALKGWARNTGDGEFSL